LLRQLAESPRQRSCAERQHPLVRSIEPGEEWSWCFVDELALMIPEVHGEVRIPPSPLGG
jgi:hypothetical protein